MKNKYYLALDDIERAVVIRSLNNLRNRLMNKNRCRDGVDDILIKIIGIRKRISKYFPLVVPCFFENDKITVLS